MRGCPGRAAHDHASYQGGCWVPDVVRRSSLLAVAEYADDAVIVDADVSFGELVDVVTA